MKRAMMMLVALMMVSGSAFAMGSSFKPQSKAYQNCLGDAFNTCYAQASASTAFPQPFYGTPEGNQFFTACKTPKEAVCVQKYL